MKINKSFFVLVMSFLISSFCFGMEAGKKGVLADFKFNTLSSWTKACLLNLREYSTRGVVRWGIFTGEKDEKALEKDELARAIDALAKSYSASDLSKKELWINEQPPDKKFLNLEYESIAGGSTIDETEGKKQIGEYYWPYIQKLQVQLDSRACIMGDYHASIHSFLRNLWRLVALGYLNDNFELQKDLRLIFLGDLVDRGRYGSEVWYTIAMLKLMNWDSVFILRGNHEGKSESMNYGFYGELTTKYESTPYGKKPKKGELNGSVLFEKICMLYRLLPHALYLGLQVSKQKQFFVQCSHGGISCGAIDEEFEPGKLLNDKSGKKYFKVSKYEGFNWSDFQQAHSGITDSRRGAGYDIGVKQAIKYLKKRNLKAFFRGHQDRSFGLKLFFADKEKKPVDMDHGSYPNGPYHWKYVVSGQDQQEKDGFLINKYPPIFTFTSATEGQVVPYDCFGIVTVKDRYKDWRLKVYETHLEEGNADRNEKYVYLKQPSKDLTLANGVSDQLLAVEWKDEKPKDEDKVLDPKLFEAPRPKKLPQSPAMIYDKDGNPIISIYQDLSGEKKSKSLLEVPKRIEGAGGRRRPTSKRVIARSIEKLKKYLQVKSNYEASVELLKAIVKSSAGKEAFTEKLTQEGIIKDKIDSLFYDYLVYGGEVADIDWDAVGKMIPHVSKDKLAKTIDDLIDKKQVKAYKVIEYLQENNVADFINEPNFKRITVEVMKRTDNEDLKNLLKEEIESLEELDRADSAFVTRDEKEFEKRQAELKRKFYEQKAQIDAERIVTELEEKEKGKKKVNQEVLEQQRIESDRKAALEKEKERRESKIKQFIYNGKDKDLPELKELFSQLDADKKYKFIEQAQDVKVFELLFQDADIKEKYTPEKKLKYLNMLADDKQEAKLTSLFKVLRNDELMKEGLDNFLKKEDNADKILYEINDEDMLKHLAAYASVDAIQKKFSILVKTDSKKAKNLVEGVSSEQKKQFSGDHINNMRIKATLGGKLDDFKDFFTDTGSEQDLQLKKVGEQLAKDKKQQALEEEKREKAAAAAAQAAQSPELDDLANSLESLKATLSELSEEFGKLTQ